MNNCVFFLLWKKSNVESAFIFYKLSFKRRWGWQGHKAGARDLLDTYPSIPWWDRKKKIRQENKLMLCTMDAKAEYRRRWCSFQMTSFFFQFRLFRLGSLHNARRCRAREKSAERRRGNCYAGNKSFV